MSEQIRESSDQQSAAAIVLGAATPWRISKEQLAAAERARLYHVNKLAGCREDAPPVADPRWAAASPPGAESMLDAGGAS